MDIYSNNNYLVKNLKKGKEEAYNYLVTCYYHKLCVYAQSFARDEYLAEDIVQNVFFKVWNKRQKLKEKYSIKNYLYRSVYNEFIDQHRKKTRLMDLEMEYVKTLDIILQEENKDIERMMALVRKEIELLPPKCKKIFILGKQEGLTYVEIAEHLNISYRTVENQMSKAFVIIREKVGDKINAILFLLFDYKVKLKF